MSGSVEDIFQRLQQIGRGSFGSVFKALNKRTGQLVAIKVLDLDTDEDEIADVQKEIQLLSQMDCDYVTKYHGSYLNGTKLWIVMDYAAGGSMRSILKSGPVEEKYIAIIAREMLLALTYLHNNAKIIHRDIKCANVLLDADGKVKLCDFGVAGQITMTSLRRNSFVGTPYWMAPEIINRANYDYKADIWSLGITIIELATGNPPFADQDPRRALFLIPRSKPARLEGNFSPAIKDFIAQCLKEEPEERPNADELLKHKFIRSAAKGTNTLTDLIARNEAWKKAHPSESDDDSESDGLQELSDEDGWIFDTYKANRMSRMRVSKRPEEMADTGTVKALRVSPERGDNSSTPQTDNNIVPPAIIGPRTTSVPSQRPQFFPNPSSLPQSPQLSPRSPASDSSPSSPQPFPSRTTQPTADTGPPPTTYLDDATVRGAPERTDANPRNKLALDVKNVPRDENDPLTPQFLMSPSTSSMFLYRTPGSSMEDLKAQQDKERELELEREKHAAVEKERTGKRKDKEDKSKAPTPQMKPAQSQNANQVGTAPSSPGSSQPGSGTTTPFTPPSPLLPTTSPLMTRRMPKTFAIRRPRINQTGVGFNGDTTSGSRSNSMSSMRETSRGFSATYAMEDSPDKNDTINASSIVARRYRSLSRRPESTEPRSNLEEWSLMEDKEEVLSLLCDKLMEGVELLSLLEKGIKGVKTGG